VKHGETKEFVIVDAAMNDLIRPAMYDAHHDILPVKEPKAGSPMIAMDVVGPICETGDRFARDRNLPILRENDLLAFATAGAYGAVMASTYNARPLVPEVLVNGDAFAVVRQRPAVEDLWSLESLPDWMNQNT